jgi:hypothetical protein
MIYSVNVMDRLELDAFFYDLPPINADEIKDVRKEPRVNSFRPTNPAPQSVSSFFLVKYPEINYKGNSFCRGESAIEFKRDQGSPRFALRRDPLSGTDAMPSLSGGSA